MDAPGSIFGSRSLLEHLARGAIAAALLAWILVHQTPHPILTTVATLVAVVAMRGCPLCWTMGLVETLLHRRPEGAPRCDC